MAYNTFQDYFVLKYERSSVEDEKKEGETVSL